MRNKRLSLLGIVMMAGLTVTTQAQTVPQWPEAQREAKAGSRWWLMGSALDETSVSHRISEYAAAGIGTLEMTPIYGVKGNTSNNLNYLSSGWMKALAYTQKLAEENGVNIDMTTGTGWPFGGSRVSIADAAGKLEYVEGSIVGDGTTEQSLSIAISSTASPTLNRVMAYPQKDNDGAVTDVTDKVNGTTLTWTAPEGKWLILAIYNSHTLQQVKRAAPGGEGYVLDHFNDEAVARYLQVFDNAFESRTAAYPHSFFNDSYEVYYANWTPKIFEEFEKYRGYKLQEHMDKLLGKGVRKDENNQVLADYRQTLSDMLLNNFTRQWTAWAHQHGATTRSQAHGSPGNLIDLYAAVDIPEIEGFGLTDFGIRGLRTDPGFTRANYSDFATLKYASSAAHITGKRLTSSETFTWLTEHFRTSLSQMKPDMDLMFCAGVNHMFFHGTTYTPDNAAWPGWKFYAAIDMSPTNSIWRDAPYMMKYMERCQSFLQMGQPDNDLLVYVPFHDAWHKNSGTHFSDILLTFPIDDVSEKLSAFTACVTAIEAAGLDCDYISDQYLLTTRYEDGCLVTEGGTKYKGLVVPVDAYMPTEVQAHLAEMQAQGANIVYKYDTPTLLSIANIQPEALRTQMGLRMIRRQNETGHHYFISNLSKDDVAGYVPLSVEFASAVLFDPMTGDVQTALHEDGQIYLDLKSGQSIIIQTYAESGVKAPADYALHAEMTGFALDGEWTLTFTNDSHPAISKTYQLDNGVQAWENLDEQTAQLMGTGIYAKTFTLTAEQVAMATGGWRIHLGDVRESARVRINGTDIGCAWSAPFALHCPPSLLKAGENQIEIEVTNLPANRIRQMDIDGKTWRIFEDVNILAIKNGSIGVSGVTSYADWEKMPSGLNSQVTLTPLHQVEQALSAEPKGFIADENDATSHYPLYRLEVPGNTISTVSVTDVSGNAFNRHTATLNADGTAWLTIRGISEQPVIVTATANGNTYQAVLPAHGAYTLSKAYDFTTSEAPECGWSGASNARLNGFDVQSESHQAKRYDAVLTTLQTGLTFTSSGSKITYLFPNYGLNMTTNATLTVDAQPYDVGVLSYMVGNADNTCPYIVEDSLIQCRQATADIAMEFELKSRNDYHVYRKVSVYTPKNDPTPVADVPAVATQDDNYYTLQGLRVSHPQRGLYIHRGRKVFLKDNTPPSGL